MNVAGLITVQPDQTDLLSELACMVGTSFLEEMWYATWLGALDAQEFDQSRKQAIMQAAILADYQATAPYGCVLALPDQAAAANIYRRSEMTDASWSTLEERTVSLFEASLSERERHLLAQRTEEMEPISGSDWLLQTVEPSEDFLYVSSVGVDSEQRGTGAFGRLFKPLLGYADEQDIAIYLDCYTDRLEQLYGHYGFELIERKRDPAFTIHERCMVRRPNTADA
ncbi:GNAT family N-acetyltransferase [Gordonibacter sp.]|uniref:GNAT family N-acetyltransferase n=1 Tax=Gordonibacter sp. TaxID=1968902 RepID=UPI002FC8A3AE